MIKKIKENIKNHYTAIKADPYFKLVVAIFLFTIIIRYFGIWNAENTDENNEVFEALRLASGHINLNRWIKKFYKNILAIEYGFYYLIGYLFGTYHGPLDFAQKIVSDMTPLFILGRITNATMGIASVVMTYYLGTLLFSKRAGLLAAIFLTVVPVHIWTSHLVNTDIPMLFWSLIALIFLVKILEKDQLKFYIYFAIFFAFALNTKDLAASLIVPFLIVFFYVQLKNKSNWREIIFGKKTWYTILAFFCAFIFSNLEILFGFKNFIHSFLYRKELYENVWEEVNYAENAYWFYIEDLWSVQFGYLLFAVSITSLIYFALKKQIKYYILIVLIIVHYLLVSNTSFLVQDRYALLLIPVMLLLSGGFIDEILSRYKIFNKLWLYLIVFLLVLQPLVLTMKYNLTLTKENTRLQSKKWIEKNIAIDSKILLDSGRTINTYSPPLAQSKEKLEEQYAIIKNLKEGETFDSQHVKMVDSYSSIYFKLLLENIPEKTYQLTSTVLGRQVENLEYYIENNFDYIITSSDITWRLRQKGWPEKYPKSNEFYTRIDKELKVIKKFEPGILRGGPVITIYQVPKS